MKTLAFRSCSNGAQTYLVLAHTSSAPEPSEWDAYVHTVRDTMSAATTTVHALVATDGGGPNAAQRKQLAAAFASGRRDGWTHVFTTDNFVRGLVTAFRWIARAHATAHEPSEFQQVCLDCGLPPLKVLQEFSELQKQLPRLNGLTLIDRAMPSAHSA